jgi:hypothetical protein
VSYVEARAVELDDFTMKSENGETKSFPDGLLHFTQIDRCHCTRKDGESYDFPRILENRYLPLTKLQNAKGEIFKFTSWRNPLAFLTPGDVVKETQGQIEGPGG